MRYAEARQIVAEDVRRSYPGLTFNQAIQHVVDTIRYDEIDDGADSTAIAYRLVLEHTFRADQVRKGDLIDRPHSSFSASTVFSTPTRHELDNGATMVRLNFGIEGGMMLEPDALVTVINRRTTDQ